MKNRTLYILCGGESRRMGQDKALLQIQGKSFLEHIIERTLPIFDSVTLLTGGRSLSTDIRQIPDAMPDVGPLGGILAALHDTQADSIALLPVDLPLISDESLHTLNAPIDKNLDARLAQSTDRIQPLCGIYHIRITGKLEQYLQSGNRAVMGFMEEINCGYFSVSEEEIRNINTPEEYRKFI
ncbi:molybdenum cofactor guanylyltransferase [Gracilimonas mengyeensis]|uniref:Probable molybdenum cofactor guanylyltransferase n=1 Tax=Gracilimonas mengyeensis TaxID=1302730 RepID=A0A521BLX5_9BACT|nr:molybdenum cofactor guanylyltransferase [Gracilimonas mengyeensis]SMO48123.1 molybdenum cofactor guanylyltransferase [Gracilimonas mengyeensis]